MAVGRSRRVSGREIMANFPAGVIYIWSGTNASIPSGWERVTTLDGKYPKGTANATNPNDTGGNATHTHTSTASHTHTIGTHTHTLTIGTGSGGGVNSQFGDQYTIIYNHNHSSVTSGGVTGASVQSVAPTWQSFSNDPPYHTVIFITPTSNQIYFPDKAIYLYDSTDSKAGHYVCNGNNSTPNLVNKYLKGANAGANAGSTGGSTTNVHTVTHAHTQTHTHSAVTVPASSDSGTKQGAVDPNTLPLKTHTHSASPNANTTSLGGTLSFTASGTIEPAYTKLLTIQNQNTGSSSCRKGMIGMWLGTLANIPNNYLLCDGTNGTTDMRSRHLKSTATAGDVGDTGGSNTHTHTAQSHNHGGSLAHTHTGSVTHAGQTGRDSDAGGLMATTATTHSISANSQSPTISSANISASSSSNEPEYRTVAFIKLNSLQHSNFMFI